MAITLTNLTSGTYSPAGPSLSAVTIPSGALGILTVFGKDNSSTTSVSSGGGYTWTLVNSIIASFGGAFQSVSIFRTLGNGSSTGTITLTQSGSPVSNDSYSIDYATGVDLGGANGANAIVQSVTGVLQAGGTNTGIAVTLAALKTGSASFGAVAVDSTSPANGSGYTALFDGSTGSFCDVQYKIAGSTTVDWTWASTAPLVAAIGLELAVGTPTLISRVTAMASILSAAYVPISYPFFGGPQPYGPKRLAPSIIAVRADAPPSADPATTPQGIANGIQAAQPDPWTYSSLGGAQPYMQRQLSPAIIGLHADNPPFGIPPAWLSSVTRAWQPPEWPFQFMGAAQPYEGLMLPPSQSAVQVDNPPFEHWERWAGAPALKTPWQPDPWPPVFPGGWQAYAPRQLNPSVTAVPVNDPPYQSPEKWPANRAIKTAWQPDPWPPVFMGGFQPYASIRLTPSIHGIVRNDPPFQYPGRWVGLPPVLQQWQPDAWPPVFAGAYQAYAPRQLNPFLTAVEVDNPPFGIPNLSILANLIYTWQPDLWPPVFLGGRQAYEPKKLSPGIPGQSVDPPPFEDQARSQLEATVISLWQPDPWLYAFMGGRQPFEPRKLSPATPGQSVDNPPFRHPAKLPQFVTEIVSWQPETWPAVFMGGLGPYTRRQLAPSITGIVPPVNQIVRNVIVRCRIVSG